MQWIDRSKATIGLDGIIYLNKQDISEQNFRKKSTDWRIREEQSSIYICMHTFYYQTEQYRRRQTEENEKREREVSVITKKRAVLVFFDITNE